MLRWKLQPLIWYLPFPVKLLIVSTLDSYMQLPERCRYELYQDPNSSVKQQILTAGNPSPNKPRGIELPSLAVSNCHRPDWLSMPWHKDIESCQTLFGGYHYGITFDPFSDISRSPAVLMSDFSSRRASRSRCIFMSSTDDNLAESNLTSSPRSAWLIILPSHNSLTSCSAKCWQLLLNRLYLGWEDINFSAAGPVSSAHGNN